ncbi:Retrovirus-related Pol polyprotein from transposon TNT 1-94 [Penicillium subrubescens]|uniref:Retrovirus-related Pol polyprotein from transposon TNT 1-94 n=1 Tax=Penicillium subrubescens TaxID=1316194 RepID=A0A1Q5TU09_9EURO|nr:Retrovirus-related Pol polyprotein from transposon TNT 1-94 [Penicillium subrubescens]
MAIRRDRQNRILFLSREAYVHKVLQQFGILDYAPVSTPVDTSPLPENGPEYVCPLSLKNKYQRIIGSLMYIMLGTRGDITFAVLAASRHLANPGLQHVKLGQRILRYLKGTRFLSLIYKGPL